MKALRRSGFTPLASLFLVFTAASACAEGDIEAGEKFAREWCSRCHNVEADGPFKLHPPSFAAIAVYRSADQIYGRMVFPPLHSGMPELGYMLMPENVEDVLAYIVSLEKE